MSSDQTGRMGVAIAELAVLRLGWIFREQPIDDQGIDAHFEDADYRELATGSVERRGTGRLIAAQIKGGSSWFDEPTARGWWFRFSEKHARLWLNHSLPVIVILTDTDQQIVYWEEISERTVQAAGAGFKVEVPRTQTVPLAGAVWHDLAGGASKLAPQVFELSLRQLAPSVSKLLMDRDEPERQDAALIAFHLATGHNNATGVVESILATEPIWVTRNGPWGWRALGNYAAAYGLGALAADAFERGGDAGGPSAARCYVAAAVNILDEDRERARRLTDEAEMAGAAVFLVAMLRAALSHPAGDAAPIPIPRDLHDEESDELRASAIAQSYLALQAKRRGDVEAALHHSELMLAADPSDTSCMAGRAEMILWAVTVGQVELALVRSALALLKEAIAQRRGWGGSTVELTTALARGCLFVGDFKTMLDVSLPSPSGSASIEDASAPEVQRLAIEASALLGRRDLVEQLATSVDDTGRGRLALYRVGALELTDAELLDLFTSDFREAVAEEDFPRVAQTALRLAQFGVDVAGDLLPFVERSIIPASTCALASRLIEVSHDLDEGLPGLRELARSDKQAAELLVGVLRTAGRYQEAVHACDSILRQGRDPLFVVLRAGALVDARDPSAESEALAAVAEVEGFPVERARLLTYAGAEAADRGDWTSAQRWLAEVLEILEAPDAASIWRVVTCEVRLGNLDRAAWLVDHYRPEVLSDEDAALWLVATASVPWDASRASEALTLASQVRDPKLAASLLGQIVTTTHGITHDRGVDDVEELELEDRRELAQCAVPGEFHKQAFLAMEALVAQHGDETGMFILRGETEDLVAQMADILKQDEERQSLIADLLKEVHESRLPMGFVATLSGHSYATLLVQRAFGPLVSASADDDEYGREFDIAASTTNARVVVDASALLTASHLGRSGMIGQFAQVLVPSGALLDIHRALSDIRASAGSPGSIRWDNNIDSLRMTELPTEEFVRQLNRADALQKLAAELPAMTPSGTELLARLDGRKQFGAWVEPIQLAHDQNCALWSDDLGLRRLAGSLGVASFGTAAVLDALRERQIRGVAPVEVDGIMERYADLTRTLAADLLVDLPLEPQDVLRLAQLDDWYPRSAAAVISRRAWWVWQVRLGAEPLLQLLAVFGRVVAERPETFGTWQLSAMSGAARALKTEFASRGLCELALLGWGPGTPDEGILDGVARARAVSRERGFADPAVELPAAAAHLASGGLVSDPDGLVERLLGAVGE